MTILDEFQDGIPYTAYTVVERIVSIGAARSLGRGCRRLVELKLPGPSTTPIMSLLRFDREELWSLSPMDDTHEIGSIRLRSDVVHKTALADPMEIFKYLAEPDLETRAGTRKFFATRSPGRRMWGSVPSWHIQTGFFPNPFPGSPPSGPFLVPTAGRLFHNLSHLAAWWTGEATERGPLAPRHGIVVPDYRAYFTRVSVVANGLRAQIRREVQGQLRVAVSGYDVLGREVLVHKVARGASVVLPNTRYLRDARILLLSDRSDYPLDEEHIGDVPAAEGDVVLGLSTVSVRRSQRLAELLMHGEGPTVEYKHWTKCDNGRLAELAETITAFANREGGSVLVGVDDHGEVVGTDTLVSTTIKASADEQARSKFATKIRESVIEAIEPRCLLNVVWHSHGDQWVLEVNVPQQVALGFSIVRTRESFMRRGATNERMNVWDAAAALSARRSRGGGFFGLGV